MLRLSGLLLSVVAGISLVHGLVSDGVGCGKRGLRLSFNGYIEMEDGSMVWVDAYNLNKLCSNNDNDGCIERPLLFLHGIYRMRLQFDDIVEKMFDIDQRMKRYPMIFVDIRGNGLSQNIVNVQSFDQLAADCVEILEYFGVDSADWIGLSTGGMIAIYAAKTIGFQSYVNRLVTLVSGPKVSDTMISTFNYIVGQMECIDPPDVWTQTLQGMLFGILNWQYTSERLKQVMYAMSYNLHYDVGVDGNVAILEADFRSGDIAQDALVMYNLCDPTFGGAANDGHAEEYLESFVNEPTVLEYDDCDAGHHMWAPASDDIATALTQWLL